MPSGDSGFGLVNILRQAVGNDSEPTKCSLAMFKLILFQIQIVSMFA